MISDVDGEAMGEENVENTNARPIETVEEVHARVPKELIPREDMEFESEDAAEIFYKAYAKAAGFGVRKSKAHIVNGVTLDRIFCCNRQGYRLSDVRDVKVKRHRPETRCGCRANMKISCRETGKYRVVKFDASHNHDCVEPTKSYLIASHRKMSVAQKAEIDIARSCGIAQKETMELMEARVGGPEYLGYTNVDCKNYLRTKRTTQMKIGDTGGVLEYLQAKQSEDPNFYYAIQIDVDGLITNIFWADAKMRSDYFHFGDAVSFDTTYKKHQDGRPIALFVGVNNHKQTIVFGAALLYDETAQTFQWLFNTFTAAMLGKKPQTLITDQDAAMLSAFESTWKGSTYHRLCIWHINQNAAKHLKSVFEKYEDFAKDFRCCMYDHDEEEDFIDAWNKMIQDYGLHDNTWLQGLFEIREKWALVYGRETFCADMSTTQRSESMNSMIKGYANYKNGLTEFFGHFERLVKNRRYRESKADFETDQSTPSLYFSTQITKHATSVYTHIIFEIFQKEVCKAFECSLEICSESEMICEYIVAGSHGKYRPHRVTYDSSDGSVSCGCKKFEFVGILCSHALHVLNLKHVVKIPDQYIKQRWTKTAKRRSVTINFQDMSQIDPKEVMSYRYRELCRLSQQLITRAAESSEGYETTKDGLLNLLKKINTRPAEFEVRDDNVDVSVPTEQQRDENDISNVQDDNVDDSVLAAHQQNDDIISKVRGIKRREKVTYKTSKRQKGCLEKPSRKKGMNTKKAGNKDDDIVPNSCLEKPSRNKGSQKKKAGNKDNDIIPTSENVLNLGDRIAPFQSSQHLQSCNIPTPYTNSNEQLSQFSSYDASQVETSFPSINFMMPFNSNYQVEGEGRNSEFSDLLKMVDPSLNDHHVSVPCNSLDHVPNNFQTHR